MTRTDDPAILAFDGLRAGYDGEEKLHGVSSRLRAGELTVIVGPNGCGKTTLVKCLAGQLKPDGGSVFLMGKDMDALRPVERAQAVAYMPQSRLIPEIPVRQLVMHGRYPHLKWGQRPGADDHRAAEAAIARVGLAGMAHKLVSQLSGGERQRAYMAMMLAQQARAMLLDEPTTYLDPSGQFELMALLKALSAEGVCVAAVLHDLSLAMRYADRIIALKAGTIEADADPADIYASGVLERVFNVRVQKIEGQYLFSPLAESD